MSEKPVDRTKWTSQMRFNAIWNQLNFALSVLHSGAKEQAEALILEAREQADEGVSAAYRERLNTPNTPASDQPDRGNHIYQEVSGDGYECFMEDQPEYRPLGPDEVIQSGDWVYKPGRQDYGRVVVDRSMLFDARGKSRYCIGLPVSSFPDYGFRRPIAAEKREDTRTCGELSCDECNERYQKAVAEISTLQKQLAQEKEARETAETLIRHLPCHCGNFGANLKCPCCQAKDAIQRWANEDARAALQQSEGK